MLRPPTLSTTPRQPGHVAPSSCQNLQLLPLCPRLQRFVSPRSATRHCRGGSHSDTHHHTSTSRFKPGLVACEDNTKVWADISVTPARILVPTALQRVVFDSLHCLAHPGVKAGMTLIKRTYWWQGIGKDVARWTKSCEACQKAKVHKHTKAPLGRLAAPTTETRQTQQHVPKCWCVSGSPDGVYQTSSRQTVGLNSPQIFGWKFADLWELRVTLLLATIRNTMARLNGCIVV